MPSPRNSSPAPRRSSFTSSLNDRSAIPGLRRAAPLAKLTGQGRYAEFRSTVGGRLQPNESAIGPPDALGKELIHAGTSRLGRARPADWRPGPGDDPAGGLGVRRDRHLREALPAPHG